MIVHRLLDVFFRTLDAVDIVRDRVDQMLGRQPRPDPWATSWPPAPPDRAEEQPAATKEDETPEQKPAPKKSSSKDTKGH